MKKNICLILCLMMLISVFASCNDAQTNESSDASDNSNSDTVSSETSSDDIVYNGGEDLYDSVAGRQGIYKRRKERKIHIQP